MKIVSNGKALEIPSCTSQDIYSTEEQVVGRWIDGKPIYQKTVLTTAPSESNKYYAILSNVDHVISYKGYLYGLNYASASYVINQFCIPNRDFWVAVTNEHKAAIAIVTTLNIHFNKPVVLTIEYTKTTDQATISTSEILSAYPDVISTADLEEPKTAYASSGAKIAN